MNCPFEGFCTRMSPEKDATEPYNETFLVNNNKSNVRAIHVNKDKSAMKENEEEESQSTTFNNLENITFKKNWKPLFQQKSAETDSLSNLTNSMTQDNNTESDFDSMQCDSTIQNEASNFANNIIKDMKSSEVESYESKSDIQSMDDKDFETFLVSASDEVVVLNDFAFGDQRNFFEIPENLKIPLNIPQESVPPKMCTKVVEELSLIEELTEHSISSTIQSKEVTPRNLFNETNFDSDINDFNPSTSSYSNQNSVPQQLEDIPCMLRLLNSKDKHKPKILNPKSARETVNSPRNKSSKMHRISSELDSTLPSKSSPSTPRDLENSKDRKSLFAQNKPKIIAKRYIRSSPPREAKPELAVAAPPIQTKTGLTVTQPKKEVAENSHLISRSVSSASLLLRNPPIPLNRMKSLSSGNICQKVPNFKKGNYDHVESKVKQYIKDIKDSSKVKKLSSAKELSKSCSNLSPETNKTERNAQNIERPKTAEEFAHHLPHNKSFSNHKIEDKNSFTSERNKLALKKAKSKSETNLRCSNLFQSPFQISRSTMSIGNIDKLLDFSDDECKETSIFNTENKEEITVHPEDLLELVYKERHGKQEAKKVLTELQTNYDNLLQKFAASENALDKVRFGAKPPPDDGSRQEAFKLAEKVAEKIASYEVQRNFESSSSVNGWLEHLQNSRGSIKFSNKDEPSEEKEIQSNSEISDLKQDQQKSMNILNQVCSFRLIK